MAEPEKKFNEGEIIIGGVFIGGIDLLCVLMDLIPGIGYAISVVIQGFTNFLMVELWFKAKGVGGGLSQKIATYFLGSLLPSGNFWVFVATVAAHNKLSNIPLLGRFIKT